MNADSGISTRPLTRAELAQHALQCFADAEGKTGLMLINLVGFDHANAVLGYRAGEQMLETACHGLQQAFRPQDQIVAVGHGQIALFVTNLKHQNHALLAAAKALRCLHDLERHNRPMRFRPTVGVAVFPDHSDSADEVLQCADQALTETRLGDSPVHMLECGSKRPTHPLAGAEALERAIEENELTLHFQPQISMANQQPTGVEALSRWFSADGPVFPDQFIALAETCGLIKPLTTWSLNTALKQWRKWQPAWPDATMAVNLSAAILNDSELVPQVRASLGLWRVPPQCLVLEVTESALMANPERGLKTLRDLHALGVRLSIDDFGTGYSSMSYLSRFPLHELKIDKSFVMNMLSDSSNEKIVRTVIDLAHKLNLETVAEGIEDEATFHALRELGCDTGQGYWISKPAAAEQIPVPGLTETSSSKRTGNKFNQSA